MHRPPWAPAEVDITRPSVARVYDFYLGGSHNFESDREFAQAALRAFPGLPSILRDGRDKLLAGLERARVVAADIREPRNVLDLAVDVGGLDLDRPVAILAVAVLHFVSDEERPAELMAEYMDALVPGAFLAISQAGRDGRPEAVDVERVYNRAGSPNAMHMRTRTEIAALFGDLELVEPGLVPPPLWRPDPADDDPEAGDDYPGVAGLGRRR